MDATEVVDRRRAERFRVLERIYAIADQSNTDPAVVDVGELSELVDEGFTAVSLEKALNYLISEELVSSPYLGGTPVHLTHKGTIEYERAVREPDVQTHYFPAVMTINHTTHHTSVHSMVGSQIQQGTQNSTQSMTAAVNGDAVVAIKAILQFFEDHLDRTAMAGDARRELEAELDTLRAQVRSPKPKVAVIVECLKSARTIVEGVASTALGSAVLPQIALALAAMA